MTIRRSRSYVLTLTLAMSLAALPSCAADADPTNAAYTITDSAGIRIVESLTPLWGDTVLQIAPEPLLRLGSEEEGPEQFGFVMQGVLLEDARIAVVEGITSEVRLFELTGQHVRTFGGAGDGPGEFRGPVLFEFRGDSASTCGSENTCARSSTGPQGTPAALMRSTQPATSSPESACSISAVRASRFRTRPPSSPKRLSPSHDSRSSARVSFCHIASLPAAMFK